MDRCEQFWVERKKRTIFMCIIVIGLLFFASVVESYANPLYVTRQKQEETKWCWAASSSMVGKWVRSSAPNQETIVKYIFILPLNVGATTGQTRTALGYATGRSAYHESRPWNSHQIRDSIDARRPILAWVRWDTLNAHVVVIDGVTPYNSPVNAQVRVIDPWANSPTTYYTLNDFVSGIQIQSGFGNYTQTLWYT